MRPSSAKTGQSDLPEVITLCGSTRFKEEFLAVNRVLTLQGKIVLSVGLFGHADRIPLTDSQKRLLDETHLKKIDLSDSIYVIDVGGYVGESTSREIMHAKQAGKAIYYYSRKDLLQ